MLSDAMEKVKKTWGLPRLRCWDPRKKHAGQVAPRRVFAFFQMAVHVQEKAARGRETAENMAWALRSLWRSS